MKLTLVVTRRTAPCTEIPVGRFPFLIGRNPKCHLRPATPLVSARHCSIDYRDDRVLIRDLNSTNGTSLNGEMIQAETELHDGDKLRVGPIKLLVQLEAAAALTPQPASVAKSDNEDDTIASLLLSMSENTKTDMAPAEDAKPLSEDTAVMAALSADTTVIRPAAPTPAPPPSPEKSSSAAADRILKSYLRRPRKS
jgi:pSer/pThr/pTyr-binding forkhead associated (FHA) protein